MFSWLNSVLRRQRPLLVCRHTPADVAEAVRQLVAGEVPVERLITARLSMSQLRTALQMVGGVAVVLHGYLRTTADLDLDLIALKRQANRPRDQEDVATLEALKAETSQEGGHDD